MDEEEEREKLTPAEEDAFYNAIQAVNDVQVAAQKAMDALQKVEQAFLDAGKTRLSDFEMLFAYWGAINAASIIFRVPFVGYKIPDRVRLRLKQNKPGDPQIKDFIREGRI